MIDSGSPKTIMNQDELPKILLIYLDTSIVNRKWATKP